MTASGRKVEVVHPQLKEKLEMIEIEVVKFLLNFFLTIFAGTFSEKLYNCSFLLV
jgi:hypothetical protein